MNVSDWVVVEYDEDLYPGEVTAVNGDFVEVDTIHTSNGKTWHWPEILMYNRAQIKATIEQPVPTGGSRGLYKFSSDLLLK